MKRPDFFRAAVEPGYIHIKPDDTDHGPRFVMCKAMLYEDFELYEPRRNIYTTLFANSINVVCPPRP
jgi:hypothetical protein